MRRLSRASSSFTPTSRLTRRQIWSKQHLEFASYGRSLANTCINSIVFVPGLGAHPLLSFKSTDSEFNWASDKDGIAREFPNARILLYHSESSWTGAIRVKQFLDNLAQTLLEGLKVKREVGLPAETNKATVNAR
jgi:hypothetical protein